MTKFRRLGLLKPKKSATKSRKTERVPQLRLMGLKKRIEDFNSDTGEVKVGDAVTSHQMKLNGLAVGLLDLQKGDKIDILQREDNTFLIAKVTGKEGRTLSANKNTDALSLTFGSAHNQMKDVAHVFEVTEESITAQNDEEKEVLGDYKWYILVPSIKAEVIVNETATSVEVKEEKKAEEVVAEKKEFF